MIPRVRGTCVLVLVCLVVGGLSTSTDRGRAASPTVNGKIAFASARNASNFEIYSINPDTTGLTRLTTDLRTDKKPAWSADGARIAFTSNRSGNDDVFVMNADGSGQTQLTTSPGSDANATWSPLGRNIAFSSTRDGDSDIYVMNEDGTGQTPLTSNDVADATPAWSPDGSKIAFLSERDGDTELYAMDVDGTDVKRLTTSPGPDVSPDWSPDGSKIAFASFRDGNWEVYVMNADGSEQTRLTRNLDVDLDPAWSPDGRYLAFTTNRDANYEIYVMNADGTSPTRLTTDSAEDTTPDWQFQKVPSPPPPPLGAASFHARWKESRVFGALVLSGEVPGLSRIQVALRRGRSVSVAVGFVLTKGRFTKRIPLPQDLLPGRYTLDVTAVDSPTELSTQQLPLLLRAPPEGVVSMAWASTTVGGPPLARLPASTSIAWAQFRLSALPRAGRTMVTTWYFGGKRPPGALPRTKPRRSPVIAFIDPPGPSLPRGTYTCVLTAGGTVVKRLTFSVT